MSLLAIASLVVGIWCVVNGLLHDIFVLRSDFGKKYDRELLRLLMDGHVLITCGAMQIISYFGLMHNAHWAYAVAVISSLSLLVYCAMIWPFLKSVVTILLNTALLGMLVFYYFNK
jgi:hypothetical protein